MLKHLFLEDINEAIQRNVIIILFELSTLIAHRLECFHKWF